MAKCKQCGVNIEVVPGKVARQFCSDAHRKAYKRSEQRTSNAPESPVLDELRTNGTKLSTSDNSGQLTTDKALSDGNMSIETLAMMDAGCGKTKPKPERTPNGYIRVSKPGDADYEPQCETTRAFIEGSVLQEGYEITAHSEQPKRGKDIKAFNDLPLDIQQTITRQCPDIVKDHAERMRRTAIAVNYQHQFPDKYY